MIALAQQSVSSTYIIKTEPLILITRKKIFALNFHYRHVWRDSVLRDIICKCFYTGSIYLFSDEIINIPRVLKPHGIISLICQQPKEQALSAVPHKHVLYKILHTRSKQEVNWSNKNLQQDPFCVCMFKIEKKIETAFLFICKLYLLKVTHMHLESFDQGVKWTYKYLATL